MLISIAPLFLSLVISVVSFFLFIYRNKAPRLHELMSILDELENNVIAEYLIKIRATRHQERLLPINSETWLNILNDVDLLKNSSAVAVTRVSQQTRSLYLNLKNALEQMNRAGSGFTLFYSPKKLNTETVLTITVDDDRPPARRVV
jgi:CRISPR/Cas system CSM-associated protein Csm2 small subunit